MIDRQTIVFITLNTSSCISACSFDFFVPLLLAQSVTAHGICHLLGYRHETEEEWKEVWMIIKSAKVQHFFNERFPFNSCISVLPDAAEGKLHT